MAIHIIGNVDKDRLYCAGSFTKLLTTFVCLSLLAEKYDLTRILDDETFLDSLCKNSSAHDFLAIFQKQIGGQFTLRDICSYYTGLPYTFDVSEAELEQVTQGAPFKHHSIPTENMFLSCCRNNITQIYPNRCKFHYSELSIIFLGYFIEKVYETTMEDLYQRYILHKWQLQVSAFSRDMLPGVYTEDLSPKYDYPSIAILNHGYFCYSNGFYTTLTDMKRLLENLLTAPVFQHMVDITKARAASNRLMNGLTVEIRLVVDDVIYGYEGLSYSGCNMWAYSTKKGEGYLTFSNNEETIYDTIYQQLGYNVFDKVPDHTQVFYNQFLKNYAHKSDLRAIPKIYQGNYQRVKINDSALNAIFKVDVDTITIRDPNLTTYDVMAYQDCYHIQCKDKVQGALVGFYSTGNGRGYMCHDGTLYRKILV